MEVIHKRVAGLDVHKATVVACVRLMSNRKVSRECRTFATTTEGLLSLLAWLTECRCTHVAMEATGVYWTPVWKILSEGAFALIVANAAHIKQVPGRKTDMNDAMWIADLLACGLIRASFAGVRNPHQLAALAHRGIKASPTELYDALHGRLTDPHRILLQLHLAQWDAADAGIQHIDREVDGRIERMDAAAKDGQVPFRALILLLCSIPGVSVLSATTILAEIGRDMSRFPTAGHLVAWAGLCPGQNESAGKRKSSRLRKGAPWLKTMLVQCAWAAKRQKNSYYAAQFQRLKSRRGPQKAICAVAASMLTAIYHMLNNGTVHQDLGADYFARLKPKPGVWLPSSPGSASRCGSNRSPRPPDGCAKLSPERQPDRRIRASRAGGFLLASEAISIVVHTLIGIARRLAPRNDSDHGMNAP
ncbi:MAG: IS110 family transposase, partial [Ktedonobacterales bacterium]